MKKKLKLKLVLVLVLVCITMCGCSTTTQNTNTPDTTTTTTSVPTQIQNINIYSDDFIKIYRKDVKERMHMGNPYMDDLEKLHNMGFKNLKGHGARFTLTASWGTNSDYTMFYPIVYTFSSEEYLVYTSENGQIHAYNLTEKPIGSDFVGYLHTPNQTPYQKENDVNQVIENTNTYALAFSKKDHLIKQYSYGQIVKIYPIPSETAIFCGISEKGLVFQDGNEVLLLRKFNKNYGIFKPWYRKNHVKKVVALDYKEGSPLILDEDEKTYYAFDGHRWATVAHKEKE